MARRPKGKPAGGSTSSGPLTGSIASQNAPPICSIQTNPDQGGSSKRIKKETDRVGEVEMLNKNPGNKPPPNIHQRMIYPQKPEPLQIKNTGGPSNNVVKIVSNYVQVEKIPDKLFVYSLTFWRYDRRRTDNEGKPSILNINKRKDLESAFKAINGREPFASDNGQHQWATDCKDLWSNVQIPADQDYGPFTWAPPGQPEVNDLRVKVGKEEVLSNIRAAFASKPASELSQELRALNAIISRPVREPDRAGYGVTQIGANKFFLDGFEDMGRGLRAQRGYFTSIRPSVSGPLLNVNTATSAFLSPMLVSEFLKWYPTQRDLDYAEKLLAGRTVYITYRRQNYEGGPDMNLEQNRKKVFQQLGKRAGQQLFYKLVPNALGKKPTKVADPQDKGRSVYDYYMKDLDLPISINVDTLCVNVGKKVDIRDSMQAQAANGAIWIPANLLEICPNQATKATLDGMHTSRMLNAACRRPLDNAGLIDLEGLAVLGLKGSQQNALNLGIQTKTNLVSFPARTLPPPKIDESKGLQNASWNVAGITLPQAASIRTISVLGVSSVRRKLDQRFIDNFTRKLQQQADDHGIEIPETSWSGTTEKGQPLLMALEKFEWLKHTQSKDFSVMVLSDRNEDEYASIKRVFDMKYGRHVGCVLERNAAKFQAQYLSNVVLKMNMKMGGINHKVDFTGVGFDIDETMVFGADVTHPSASHPVGYPSIAAVVGSVDKTFMNYPGSMRLQAGRQEEIAALKDMVSDRLRAFLRIRGQLPENILFYRDGISESQFASCVEKEISAVKAAYEDRCKALERPNNLKLTFVVVGKRHNTRLFPTRPQDVIDWNRGNTNLRPGVYVPDHITDPGHQNFYLQSHNAIKGTARPAHYHVLEDGMGLRANLPQITYKLCHTFARATKGVSYASPAYIADRLCERGRVYLRGWQPDHTFRTPLDGNRQPITTLDGIQEWKTQKAKEAERVTAHWGQGGCNTTDPTRPLKPNPWHKDLDDSMFWM